MTNIWDDIKSSITALAGNWASFVALGSFTTYLLGYLVVRFHLTVFGIGTDLTVLDERYLFAGAKFLVYLFSTIPIFIFVIVVVIMFILGLAISVYVFSWLLSKVWSRVSARPGLIKKVWRRILFLWSHPHRILKRLEVETLLFIGIVFSVWLIQFVMRQCFLFEELLLARSFLTDHWFVSILLDESGQSQYYYFSALVIGTLLSLGILLAARKRKRRRRAQFLVWLLGLLVAIEFLFLPINYGILVFDKAVPEVQSLGGQQELTRCHESYVEDCQEAWLVWEGTEGQTYLVRTWKQGAASRQLITLPRKETKRLEINRFDNILVKLFANKGASQ